MSGRGDLITERDGDDGMVDLPPSRQSSLPDGLSGGHPGTQRAPQGRQDDPDFEIIDTDSHFQPIRPDQGAPAAPPEDGDGQDAGQDAAQDGGTASQREDRAARRERQKQGRERTMRENARLHGEVAELRERLNSFEPRLSEYDQARLQDQVAGIDRQIDEQAQRAATARRQMAEAMVNQDSEALNTALDARDQAIIHGQRLLQQKNLLANGAQVAPRGEPQQQQQPQRQAPAPMPAAVRAYVEEFAEQHPWFDPSNPRDLDSKVALDIDNAVAAEGFQPNTQDYWDEVNDRMRRYLPHRFQQQQGRQPQRQQQAPQRQQAPERRGPMTGGASDRGPAPGPNQVYLSPERKETMILAGILERDGRTVADKAKFARTLKQYQEFDRLNGVAR